MRRSLGCRRFCSPIQRLVRVIQGTGGLRKMRFSDPRRRKGKRGGLRIIYFWWEAGSQFWLFTLYDKDEIADLSATQRKVFKAMLDTEIKLRRSR